LFLPLIFKFSTKMLQKLIIHNYAIIDHIEIDFGPGLNILTGETGAGKSIIVDSLGLLLGERVVSGLLRKGERSGYVEGRFINYGGGINISANVNAEKTVLRREMTESGGSRYLINGTPTVINEAKNIYNKLVDLHGQHQHQSLIYPENYFKIVDTFAGAEKLSEDVSEKFKKIRNLQSAKDGLVQKSEKIKETRDFLEFQLRELESADPQEGELAQLEKEARLLKNAEIIVKNAVECYGLLYDNESSAASQIRSVTNLLEVFDGIIDNFSELKKDLESAVISIEETAGILQKYTGNVEFNPDRLEQINERISLLNGMMKKYGCGIDGLIAKKDEIKNDLSGSENLNSEILKLDKDIENGIKDYKNSVVKLSKTRNKAAAEMEKGIIKRFKSLGMSKSIFNIKVHQREAGFTDESGVQVTIDGANLIGTEKGIDIIDFLIGTGKSERILPVSQIASVPCNAGDKIRFDGSR